MKLADAGRAITILVAEDNPADRRLIAEAFEELTLATKVSFADSGAAAVQMLTDAPRPPDLMLLDMSLPRVDGTEVLGWAKRDPQLRRVPLIVLTGSADPVDIQRMLDLGANSYVTKPHDIGGFRALARAIEVFWFSTADVPAY